MVGHKSDEPIRASVQGDSETCLETNPDKSVVRYVMVMGMFGGMSILVAVMRTVGLSVMSAIVPVHMMVFLLLLPSMSMIMAIVITMVMFLIFQDRDIP